jgi:hypothetical protein
VICSKCKQEKPRHEFPKRDGEKACLACIRLKYNYENFRKCYLPRAYGISVQEYDKLVKNQDGKCCICGEIPKRWLVVDHCHKTGVIRGLLCDDCNMALGRFKDDPVLLTKALEYLLKQREPPSLESLMLRRF